MNGNDFMTWILRSPFHGLLSNGIMLITISGCKTGRKFTMPVGYYHEGNDLWVITSRDRTWWRNLREGAAVDLLIKRKPVRAMAGLELDQQSVQARMPEYLKRVPQAARSLGIRMDRGIPNAEDIARTAKERLFVRITLT